MEKSIGSNQPQASGASKAAGASSQRNQKKRARVEDATAPKNDFQDAKRRKILESLLADTKSRDAAMAEDPTGAKAKAAKSGKGFLYKSNFSSSDRSKKFNKPKPGAKSGSSQQKAPRPMLSDDSDGEEKTFARSQPQQRVQKPQQKSPKAPHQNQPKPAAARPQQNKPTPQKEKQPVADASDDSDSDEPTGNLSDMQAKMKAKLEGGRFRFINEKLYTTQGREAFTLFQKQPDLFDVYHDGYRNQVEKWPENPLDVFINFFNSKPEKLIVADFGCGEARLAQSVKQKVHSFDLVARNKFITACDISRVPLKDNTVDVAIFSLSLMGTNFMDFLKEAHRVVKIGGELKIAEVKSRFENYSIFIKAMRKMGFDLIHQDDSNKMFVLFDFLKTARKSEVIPVTLKPCKYKKR